MKQNARNSLRLFHVSEEPDIRVFEPRIPTRKDLDPTVGLVWAIDEAHLPNFLTPRDCPRVAYHAGVQTTEEDRRRFFTSSENSYAVVIEARWFSVLRNTTLFLYEFDPRDFRLQDEECRTARNKIKNGETSSEVSPVFRNYRISTDLPVAADS
jgi:hypothetical protein